MKRMDRNYSNLKNYSDRNKLVKIIKFKILYRYKKIHQNNMLRALSFLIKVKLHTIYHVLALDVIDIALEFSFFVYVYPRTFYFYNKIFIISIDMTDILIYLVFSWGQDDCRKQYRRYRYFIPSRIHLVNSLIKMQWTVEQKHGEKGLWRGNSVLIKSWLFCNDTSNYRLYCNNTRKFVL